MFYPPEQGNNDNIARVPAQYILDSLAFSETCRWSQNLSQTDLDEGKRQAAVLYTSNFANINVITAANIHLNHPVLAYSQAEHNAIQSAQAANLQGANASRRSSETTAPHLELSTSLAGQAFTPSNLVGESCVPCQQPLRPS